jgi:RNA polymerase sigma-70 factor (ECF subfamily)
MSSGSDDAELLERLRSGDQAAYAEVVRCWSPAMVRLARSFVGSTASAQDVVQEAWLAIVTGLERFQGRAAVRTWALAITANIARRRGSTDARVIPFDTLVRVPRGEPIAGTPAVEGPEQRALRAELAAAIRESLAEVPERQRAVVALRDVHGLEPDAVCRILRITDGNQRILLHRGRSRLRELLRSRYPELLADRLAACRSAA